MAEVLSLRARVRFKAALHRRHLAIPEPAGSPRIQTTYAPVIPGFPAKARQFVVFVAAKTTFVGRDAVVVRGATFIVFIFLMYSGYVV